MVSPSQAYFLRENLKLRLLNARLALLSRNEAAFRSDLDRRPGRAAEVLRHARPHHPDRAGAAAPGPGQQPGDRDADAVRQPERRAQLQSEAISHAPSSLVSRTDGSGHRHRRHGALQSGQRGVVLSAAPDRPVAQLLRGAAGAAVRLPVLRWCARSAPPLAMPAKVAAYRQRKRERDGNKGLRDALKALFEGRFGHAEKAAARAAELPENAGLAALIGARAAHRMRQARAPRRLAGRHRARQQPEDRAPDDGHRTAGRRPPAGSGAGRGGGTERQRHAPHPRAAMVDEGQPAGQELARSAAPGALARQAQGAASGAVVAPARAGLRRAAVGRLARRRIDQARVGHRAGRRPRQAVHRRARGARAERARPARRSAHHGRRSAEACEWDDRVVRAYREAAGAGRFADAAGPDRALRRMDARSVRTTPNWR